MSSFSPEESFAKVKESTTQAVKEHFPVVGKKNSLIAKEVWVEDNKTSDELNKQKEAKILGRSWTVPVKANLQLVDNKTGKVLDEKETTIAQLPKMTSRYSYLVNGGEYQVQNQFRLKSGVYSRIKANGELEGHWNLEKGLGFKMNFDPRDRKMALQYGTTNVNLYPVLKTLGMDDDSIQKHWGKELLTSNMESDKKQEGDLKKLYETLTGKSSDDMSVVKNGIRTALSQTKLRADSTQLTLGKAYDKVDASSLLAGSEKMLKVSRLEEEPDDRDSLVFKDFLSTEDMLAERIGKDVKRDIQRKLVSKVDRAAAVQSVVDPNIFGKPIKTFFTNSAISERPTQMNPMSFIAGHRRTTIGGEHGLTKDNTVTLEAQALNPSKFGFLDPIQTPESARTGTILQMASGTKKVGKEIRTEVYNVRTGKTEWLSPLQAQRANVAFPDQYVWEGGKPKPVGNAIKVMDTNMDQVSIAPDKVDYVIKSSKNLFDLTANSVPFLDTDNGNRAMMAAKMLEQAVPLVDREIPLVQSKGSGDETFEGAIGKLSSHSSPIDGKVIKVEKDGIVLRDAKGKHHRVDIYDDFPLNDNKSVMTSEPLVKVGDAVKAGQTIADTNFTKGGTLALGTNLTVAYTPYKGYNFEDGVVISESAAKKLTSSHMLRHEVTANKNIILNKNRFLAETAGQVTKDQADKLDEFGVIKEGQTVNPGDVLIGTLKQQVLTPEQQQLQMFSKKLFKNVAPQPTVWDKDYAGRVTKVVRHGKETTVYVRTQRPMEIGDKLAGRHGNKGIVTSILPDQEMPRVIDGKPVEVLLNPTGVPTRMNLGQVLETAAGKLADKKGAPYIANNFDPTNTNVTSNLRKELAQSGVSDTETLIDPTTGKKLGDALVGKQYILKLHHTAEKGISARFRGAYDVNLSPKKGGEKSGQSMDTFGLYALLAHGARENIKEMQTVKSDLNDDYWTTVQAGHAPPAPSVPFAYKKFEGYLQAMGIDVQKNGNKLHLGPMTDKQVLSMSNGEITNPDKALKHTSKSELKPEKGGLFDPKVTGTTNILNGLGNKWGHIELPKRMPNPVFETSARSLLGMSKDTYLGIIEGKQQYKGKTGPEAIVSALEEIDVKKELETSRSRIPNLTGSRLNQETKKAKYLRALDERGIAPAEAYTQKYMSVLPPTMRPITVLDNGELRIDDVGSIYHQIGQVTDQMKRPMAGVPKDDPTLKALDASLYDGMKSLTLTGMTHKGRYRKGIAEIIGGAGTAGPKEAYFQEKVIGKRQDLSMRGVIVPEPSLGIDEVAIPKKAAQEIYKPFVVRRLVQQSFMTPGEAMQQVKKNTPLADKALDLEMDARPLLLKRDPVLHKYGIQAFKPKITKGKAIKIHPLATSGYNADFDGDKMAAFVPVGPKAVEESFKMLPSKNLFSPSNGRIMFVPGHESMLGLHLISKFGRQTDHKFATAADAALAAKQGKIGITDVVTIANPSTVIPDSKDPLYTGPMKKEAAAVRTTVGRLLVNNALPEKMRDPVFLTDSKFDLNRSQLNNLLTKVGVDHSSKDFSRTADRLKDIGNTYSTGFSFGLADIEADPHDVKYRDAVLTAAKKEEARIRSRVKDRREANKSVGEIYAKAVPIIDSKAKARLDNSNNRLYAWVKSGARGDWDQFAQMTVAPIAVADSYGKPIPTPIEKSFGEGLDTSSYWASMHGATMGTVGRAKGTAEPGTMTKEMMQTSLTQLVESDDCGTAKGILKSVDDSNALNRFTAAEIKLGVRGGKDKGTIPAGTLVTPEIVTRLKNNGVKDLPVRTPLKCSHGDGVCAKCFGLTESGQLPEKGDNLGVKAAHALGEPMTQMAMDAFHTGGRLGAKGTNRSDKFTRVKQLVQFPQVLPGSATLAEEGGKVQKVEVDKVAGGYGVYIQGKKHYIPADRGKPVVRVGVDVKKGEALSGGPKNPLEMLPLTGISSVQSYLVDEMENTYPGKSNIHRRNSEVFVRALTNLSIVQDSGSHPKYLKGDRAPTSELAAYNSNLKEGQQPVKFNPVLKGTNVLPTEIQTDWMARLQFQDLKRTIIDGANEGWSTDLHGAHPTPAMAYGKEFGQGTPEKPWRY